MFVEEVEDVLMVYIFKFKVVIIWNGEKGYYCNEEFGGLIYMECEMWIVVIGVGVLGFCFVYKL